MINKIYAAVSAAVSAQFTARIGNDMEEGGDDFAFVECQGLRVYDDGTVFTEMCTPPTRWDPGDHDWHEQETIVADTAEEIAAAFIARVQKLANAQKAEQYELDAWLQEEAAAQRIVDHWVMDDGTDDGTDYTQLAERMHAELVQANAEADAAADAAGRCELCNSPRDSDQDCINVDCVHYARSFRAIDVNQVAEDYARAHDHTNAFDYDPS